MMKVQYLYDIVLEIDRYWKEVMQVSTLKNDIKIQYIYKSNSDRQSSYLTSTFVPVHVLMMSYLSSILAF